MTALTVHYLHLEKLKIFVNGKNPKGGIWLPKKIEAYWDTDKFPMVEVLGKLGFITASEVTSPTEELTCVFLPENWSVVGDANTFKIWTILDEKSNERLHVCVRTLITTRSVYDLHPWARFIPAVSIGSRCSPAGEGEHDWWTVVRYLREIVFEVYGGKEETEVRVHEITTEEELEEFFRTASIDNTETESADRIKAISYCNVHYPLWRKDPFAYW